MTACAGRTAWLVLPLLLAGEPLTPAYQAWQLGQTALERDEVDQAVGQFQLSLRLDPNLVQAHLGLAAAHLARGEDSRALPHLARYAQTRPGHLSVRAHYADLLFRLDRLVEARVQFERLVVDAQGAEKSATEHLVHCHTRLMEIGDRTADEYAIHLHRGIGLYHLACRRGELKDESSRADAESLLCRAAAELTLARLECPGQIRPCWYLHAVWQQLAQQPPARRWLRAALKGDDALSDLTPVERRDLHLARRLLEDDQRKR